MMTFLNPIMLAFGVFVAIPFIIHFMGERKYQPLAFSSLKFLREIERESLQKLHLRQWLILLSRALWIAMLVLALAQPFINTTKGKLNESILIVDKSFSTHIDPEYAEIETAIKYEHPGIPYLEYTEESNIDSFQQQLKSLVQDHKFEQANILILTDLQDNEQNRQIINIAGSKSEKVYVIPKFKNAPNNAIEDIKTIYTQNNDMLGVEILSSSSDTIRTESNINISINGKYRGQTQSKKNGLASYYFSRPTDDQISCIVETIDDEYPQDNKRYLAINNYQQKKILCVRENSSGHYHLNALRAMEDVDVFEIAPEQLLTINIFEYDVLWFSGSYQVNDGFINSLKQYAKEHPVLLTTDRPVSALNPWHQICGTIRENDQEDGYLSLQDLHDQSGHGDFRIKRYYSSDKEAIDVYWATSNDKAILYEAEENIYLLTSPFHFNWNEMGLSPYFTRAISRMLNTMLDIQGLMFNINETIPLNGALTYVTSPTGEKYQVKDKFQNTRTPGFYTIESNGTSRIVAVNIPSEECVLSKLNDLRVDMIKWDGTHVEDISKQIRGRNSQTLFFILAALFIIFEMILLGKGERTK